MLTNFVLLCILICLRNVQDLNAEKTYMAFGYNREPNIVYLGFNIEVTCELCGTGHNISFLTWVLVTRNGHLEEISETDHRVRKSLDADHFYCPMDEANSNVKLSVTQKLDKATLSCFSNHYPGPRGRCGGAPHCQASRELDVRYGPQKPSLTVKARHPLDSLVHGYKIRAICQACVEQGNDGHIFWGVAKGTVVKHIQDAGVDVRHYEEVNVPKDEWLKIDGGAYDRRYKHCGKVVNSSLVIDIDESLDGMRIACYPYNFSDSTYTFRAKDDLVAFSKQISVKEVQKSKILDESKYTSILLYPAGLLVIVWMMYQMFYLPDGQRLHGDDSQDDLQGQDELWNTEPEISKIMTSHSDTMFHDVINLGEPRTVGGHRDTPSMFVQVPSSVVLDCRPSEEQQVYDWRGGPLRLGRSTSGTSV